MNTKAMLLLAVVALGSGCAATGYGPESEWRLDLQCRDFVARHPHDARSRGCLNALWGAHNARLRQEAQEPGPSGREVLVRILTGINAGSRAMQTPPPPRKIEMECHPDPYSIPAGGQICKEK